MPRKPSAVLQYKLRIKESLRRRIEQAAAKRGVSANYEMVTRLERSFDHEHTATIDGVAVHIEDRWARLDGIFHNLDRQGDLIRAAAALLEQIDAGDDRGITKAAGQVKRVIQMIELEAAKLPAKMHTTGGL